MTPPPPPRPPPASLPPLRPPLPSLFQHRQELRQHDTSAETYVPPLRWRRRALEIETGVAGEAESTVAIPANQDDRLRGTKKRLRDVIIAGDDTSDGSIATPRDPSRTKKSAHVLHREERRDLLDEVQALTAQIEQLQCLVGLPTDKDKAALDDDQASNMDMEDSVLRNHLYLGRLHSMLTNELLLPAINTLSTFIHLPKDMAQRRAILRGLQEAKLQRGIEVAMDRLHHLDPLAPYRTDERFTSPSGEYHWQHFAIHQFPNFSSARQFYDVSLKLAQDVEVNLTEMLRQITLREDTEDVDPTIWNHRLITVAEDVGCTEELNCVGFAHFYNHSSRTNSPLGIIVTDTVNIDDLYPYEPEARTCKDYQGVLLIYESGKPGTTETVVVVKYCAFAVQLVPQFALPPGALKQLQENTSRWPEAFMKYLHTYDATQDGSVES